MNFSKTTEYALRILSYMSLDENRLYSATDLFEKLQIPFRYLRKQLQFLQNQGLLTSTQGKQGGYRIAKPLKDISLMDIVESTDEVLDANRCFFGFQECPLTNRCVLHDKWGDMRSQTFEILKTTTLFDLKNSTNL